MCVVKDNSNNINHTNKYYYRAEESAKWVREKKNINNKKGCKNKKETKVIVVPGHRAERNRDRDGNLCVIAVIHVAGIRSGVPPGTTWWRIMRLVRIYRRIYIHIHNCIFQRSPQLPRMLLLLNTNVIYHTLVVEITE